MQVLEGEGCAEGLTELNGSARLCVSIQTDRVSGPGRVWCWESLTHLSPG